MSEVVVIVDDGPYILHVLAIKLRNAGYTVYTAADGEAALDVCQNVVPDLIITDYQMPYLTGPEFCWKYRELSGRKLPILMITARDFDVDGTELTKAGIDIAITKPFSPREIIEQVRAALKKYKSPSSAA